MLTVYCFWFVMGVFLLMEDGVLPFAGFNASALQDFGSVEGSQWAHFLGAFH